MWATASGFENGAQRNSLCVGERDTNFPGHESLYENGTDAVLIGETLMRAPDKKAMLRELRGKIG